MVCKVVEEGPKVGIDKIRALFFLILNVDMPIKEYICDPHNKDLYAAAVGIRVEEVDEKHSYSVLGTKPIEKEKARRFMLELNDLVRAWLSNEALNHSDLVAKVKVMKKPAHLSIVWY